MTKMKKVRFKEIDVGKDKDSIIHEKYDFLPLVVIIFLLVVLFFLINYKLF